MSSDFLEDLTEAMVSKIDQPGVPCAREEFVVHKPAYMSDEDWAAWCEDMRAAMGDPVVRTAAAERLSSSTSA